MFPMFSINVPVTTGINVQLTCRRICHPSLYSALEQQSSLPLFAGAHHWQAQHFDEIDKRNDNNWLGSNKNDQWNALGLKLWSLRNDVDALYPFFSKNYDRICLETKISTGRDMMMASYLISDKVSGQKERNMIGTYALKIISFTWMMMMVMTAPYLSKWSQAEKYSVLWRKVVSGGFDSDLDLDHRICIW